MNKDRLNTRVGSPPSTRTSNIENMSRIVNGGDGPFLPSQARPVANGTLRYRTDYSLHVPARESLCHTNPKPSRQTIAKADRERREMHPYTSCSRVMLIVGR